MSMAIFCRKHLATAAVYRAGPVISVSRRRSSLEQVESPVTPQTSVGRDRTEHHNTLVVSRHSSRVYRVTVRRC